ncbi:MAG: carbamoyltransferase HypF [Deltaproteobacteria bacterium]|nr:carbamoyltransferase HypF [Deltaproteobacteria bacterium]
MIRIGLALRGVVQGVGFRPFVFRLAEREGLTGLVQNLGSEVRIEVQGLAPRVARFEHALGSELPAAARIVSVARTALPLCDEPGFAIRPSERAPHVRPALPTDLATCPACRAEVLSPAERRHGYPFASCTACGPRYTIVEALPYDRASTSMRGFSLCAACRREFDDPRDRRFHAQPIACPICGPALRLLDSRGVELVRGAPALTAAVRLLGRGEILAAKSLGGYQLLVDATDPGAVARLRAGKGRDDKPFAVMFSAPEAMTPWCDLSADERAALSSPAAPILLARRRELPDPLPRTAGGLALEALAPGNRDLGVMLPSTPLYLLLLEELGRPVVCTSGNLAEEPMCTDEPEALARLGKLADAFLVHDRPIVRPVDDSVVRVTGAGPQLVRRARGYAPLPLPLARAGREACVLALGAELKSTVALLLGEEAVVSQHLGDLRSAGGARLLARTVDDLLGFFAARPELLVCDLHPDYASSRLAEKLATAHGVPLLRAQHHHAHVAAVMAEHALEGPVLGLAWDGAGLGSDGTLWGGEALVVERAGFSRVAHLEPFPLPGGERAFREPWRAALGLLFAHAPELASSFAAEVLPAPEAALLLETLRSGVASPRTSSVGRLFDAVAALAGLRTGPSYEGQAALLLEQAAREVGPVEPYPLPLGDGPPMVASLGPFVDALLAERRRHAAPSVLAARLHETLAALAEAIAARVGLEPVVLAGGCFLNERLTARTRERLLARGHQVYLSRDFPPGDGAISLGQARLGDWSLDGARAVYVETSRTSSSR